MATYGLVLGLLGLFPLEGHAMALVLETLGRNQPLDPGSLGVRLLALSLGSDLSSNDELSDLFIPTESHISHLLPSPICIVLATTSRFRETIALLTLYPGCASTHCRPG